MDAMVEQDGVKAASVEARLCVLGSGSKANCSVLHARIADGNGAVRDSVCLIDLGFSPRATERLLGEVGLTMEMVEAVLLTHLDSDHCHGGWNVPGALPRAAELLLHDKHLQRAYSRGLNGGRLRPFRGERGKCGDRFTIDRTGLCVHPLMTFHDDLGVAVFHLTVGEGAEAPSLGYATDLGRVTDELIGHLGVDGAMGGVDVLVIESNYCPKLQVESDRPEFLKRRVMGGRGHLSNQEALEAVEAIMPREHVVLVHLSQQCNDPELVSSLHEGCVGGYTLTISAQNAPTRWVPVRRQARTEIITRTGQMRMWA